MKIRQRNNGHWVMEHKGVEAPYVVIPKGNNKFSVFDIDDENFENPIADSKLAVTCEEIARWDFD